VCAYCPKNQHKFWRNSESTMGKSRLALWLGVSVYLPWVLCGRAGGQVAEPHERGPIDPWIRAPRPPAAAGASCQSHVIRDQFRSIQVNVDSRGCNILGDAANEPSIAVSPTDPRKIVIGWRQFNSMQSDFREPGWAYSQDGGHSWVFRGSLDPGVFGSDPVLASGPGGETYYLSINSAEMRLFHSFDSGVSWARWSEVSSGFIDKPWIVVDQTPGAGRGNIYIAANYFFARSVDGGESFAEQAHDLGAPSPTISVAPDGTVYVAEESGSVFVSWDAMHSADIPSFEYLGNLGYTSFYIRSDCCPNPDGLHAQSWIVVDHSTGGTRGNLYVAGGRQPKPDVLELDFAVSRSTDLGQTWSQPVRIHDDAHESGAWQWFGMISVAANGRIDAVWNDTRNFVDAPSGRLSELYYAYSVDAGVTWSKNVPVSPVFDTHLGWPGPTPGRNLKIGDYYHMLSDNLGVNVAYAATFNGEQDIYFLRIGPWDCNANEIDDAADIKEARSRDCNANDVPDECEYRADVNGDGLTTLSDFTAFRAALTGPTADTAVPHPCFELLDPDHDGDMDLADFYLLEHVFVAP